MSRNSRKYLPPPRNSQYISTKTKGRTNSTKISRRTAFPPKIDRIRPRGGEQSERGSLLENFTTASVVTMAKDGNNEAMVELAIRAIRGDQQAINTYNRLKDDITASVRELESRSATDPVARHQAREMWKLLGRANQAARDDAGRRGNRRPDKFDDFSMETIMRMSRANNVGAITELTTRVIRGDQQAINTYTRMKDDLAISARALEVRGQTDPEALSQARQLWKQFGKANAALNQAQNQAERN